MPEKHMSGGEAMIRSAIENGIETFFGIPGAQIYPMYDAMHRLGVQSITTRHEQGAAYMALGYARATGRPAAFAVVPGPGVLNTGAALCTAMGTNAPVLCLTGQVPRQYLGSGRGHLHELPNQQITLGSFIKGAHHISDPGQTSQIVNQAVQQMQSGRPGPVSVEMCWDTMAEMHDIEIAPGAALTQQPVDESEIDEAAGLLRAAKRPLIMCGGGAQHASAEVLALAEKLGAPVTSFRSGRGIVSEDHPLGVSSVAARLLFDETDLVIGIGSRLEMIYMRWRDMNTYERRPSEPGRPLIRIDIDPQEFSRLEPNVGILADAASACRHLCDALPAPQQQTRPTRIAEAKAEAARLVASIQPQMSYLSVIRDVLPRDGFFVPELSQMGFTSYFGWPVYEPRTYVTEGYQGTLGFGFMTALGVKVACPERAVVAVTGDGGFMFGVQELATAVAHDIGVVTVIFNNGSFGNVRRDQERVFEGRLIGADFINPDFVQLAESFGAKGYRVDSPPALQRALADALAADKPAVIDVVIEKGVETSPWDFIMMPNRPG